MFQSAPIANLSSEACSSRPASLDETHDVGRLLGSLQLVDDVRRRPVGPDELCLVTSGSDSYSARGDDSDDGRDLAACDLECGYYDR